MCWRKKLSHNRNLTKGDKCGGQRNELKEGAMVNGFQSPVKLAIDPVSFKYNLHDGKHRMACASELNLMWIPVRVLRLSLRFANNYLKVPKVPESFPNLPCPCKFGFTTFRDKED